MIQIIQGDCLDVLDMLPSEMFDCVVTSPPYWGLRDYGVEGQIGLEHDLHTHISTLVNVFREVRRVLKKTGTLWLNYGDAYASSVNGRSAADTKAAGNDDRTFRDKPLNTVGGFLKPKDRMMLPARVAIALQEDGWWLRDEIVWHKPNPMPISVKDRTTPAHEMLYMFSRTPRYYYDKAAIDEPIAETSKKRYAQSTIETQNGGAKQDAYESGLTGQPTRSRRPNEIVKALAKQHNNYDEKLIHSEKWGACHAGWEAVKDSVTTRNKRSVWRIPTKPCPEAHFATFPPDLIRPCILAGAPLGGNVLDPFGGAGTVGLVCQELGRNATLIELNSKYVDIAERRIRAVDIFA